MRFEKRDLRFEELYCATRLREGKVVRSTKGGRGLRFEVVAVAFCYPLSAFRGRESDCQTSHWHGTWKCIPYLRQVT